MSRSSSGRAKVPAVAVIGLGRVGSALALALDEATDVRLSVWDRRPRQRSTARARLGRSRVCATCGEAFAAAEVVILALPDGALRSFEPPVGPPRTVAHTSGLLPASALGRCAAAGHRVAGWHPLRSFPRRWAPASFEGTVVAVEGGRSARAALVAMSRALGARPFAIRPESRALYHAAAALTGNHAILLAHLATGWMRRAGLTESQARAGLGALLASAAENLARHGARSALTGPLRRGDASAIAQHVAAIRREDPGALTAYVETALAGLRGDEPAIVLPRSVVRRLEAALRGVRS